MHAIDQNIIKRITAEIPNVPWVWPLWSMIFSEQAKGSHLLFSPLDRLNFRTELKKSSTKYEDLSLADIKEPSMRIQQIVFELVCANDLQNAIALVDECDFDTKFELFKISKVVASLVQSQKS